jgi:hypothetical protein
MAPMLRQRVARGETEKKKKKKKNILLGALRMHIHDDGTPIHSLSAGPAA